MIYTITSDYAEGMGMHEPLNRYEVKAMSVIDAVIKASKNAGSDEEIICAKDEEVEVTAYRLDDGSYEFHVYDDYADLAFTI